MLIIMNLLQGTEDNRNRIVSRYYKRIMKCLLATLPFYVNIFFKILIIFPLCVPVVSRGV